MPNLAKYLLASNSIYHRKVKPRFWWLVAVVVVIILGVVFWDKLGSIVPKSFATSVYWKGVL